MLIKIALAALCAVAWPSTFPRETSDTPRDTRNETVVVSESAAFVNAGVWAVGGGGVTRFTARGAHLITNNGPDYIIVQTRLGGTLIVKGIGKNQAAMIPALAGGAVAIRSQGPNGANGTR